MKSEFDAKKFVQLFMAGYVPRSKDEKKFVDKHVAQLHQDVNGNKDDVFKATNVPTHARPPYHGYNKGQDERMYEGVEDKDSYEALKNTTTIKSFKSKDGSHTAEVKYHNDLSDSEGRDIYGVHHYLNGNHVGVHSISWHSNKNDAIQQANKDIKNNATPWLKKIDPYMSEYDHDEIKNSSVLSKHEGKDGHTAEVRYRKDLDQYSVHHYLDDQHMGSSNITLHDTKKDAEATARYTTTTRNSDYTASKSAPTLKQALNDIKKVRKWYGVPQKMDKSRAFPEVQDGRGIKEAIEALEEEMTDSQMAKRERIVKSMKKKSATFEKRYGDKAKEVMYATATKMAMEDLDYVNLDMTDEVYALIEEYEEKEDREKKGLKHIESHAKKVREVTKKYPVAQRNESVIEQLIAAMDLDEEIITITFDNGEEAELERDIAESILNIFSDLSEENQFNFEEAISEGIEAFEHALAFIAEAYEGAE